MVRQQRAEPADCHHAFQGSVREPVPACPGYSGSRRQLGLREPTSCGACRQTRYFTLMVTVTVLAFEALYALVALAFTLSLTL